VLVVDSLSLGAAPLVPPTAPTAPAPPVIDFALPPPQAALAASGIIAATVTASDVESVLAFKTDFGTLALKTNLTLPSGTPVELKLFAGPPAGAAILTANGQPLGYGALRAAGTPVPAPLPGTPAPPTPAAPSTEIALGQTVRATVVTPAGTADAPPAGSQLTLRLSVPAQAASPAIPATGTVAPSAGTPTSTLAAAPATPEVNASSTPVATAGAAANPPATGATPPLASIAGAPVATTATPPTRFVAVPVAPATSGGAPTPAPITPVILGTIGQTSGAVTLLETPAGLLSLEQHLDLAPGTLVNLQRLDVPAGAAPPSPSAQALASPALGSGWPALDDTLKTLDRVAPGLASQMRADLTPTTAPRLAATLLFFVGVLKGAADWPPDSVNAALTTAGRGDLRTRLQKDVSEMRRVSADGTKTDWRVLTLPVLDENAVQPVRLYVRRDTDGQTSQQRDERGSRFVLDLDMSRLGALQLDGLVRKGRFDLVLRSHEPMAADVKTDMASIFRNSLAASGFTGDIAFVTTARFPVAPLEELRPHLGIKI
jgi:hypothetical protein